MLLLASFTLLIGIIVGCVARGDDSPPTLCVTIQPQKLFAESIVGDKFAIYCMLPSSGCEAEVNYTPSNNLLENAVAYLKVGGVICEDACLESVLQSHPDIDVYDTSVGIDTIMGASAWCSPKQALVIATNMYQAILELDPRHKEYYKKRFDLLEQELHAVDSYLSKKLEPLAHQAAFIVDSPSYAYLAQDYDLTQVCIEHADSEPFPRLLALDIDKVVPVRAIFVQSQSSLKQATTLAGELGCGVASINTLNYEWFEEIENIANALTAMVAMPDDTRPQEKLQ